MTIAEKLHAVLEGRRFWGVRASGVLLYRDGQICIFRRSGTLNSGTWGIPGGKVDTGEDPKESAKRECEEETGTFPAGRFTGQDFVFKLPLTSEDYIDGDYGERRAAKEGEEFTYTTFLYQVSDREWEPELNREHDKYEWVDPSSLPKETVALKDARGREVKPLEQAVAALAIHI